MDLANLNLTEMADRGAWLRITHPISGRDTDMRIRLAGKDSGAWKRVVKLFKAKNALKLQRNPELTDEMIDQLGVDCLAAVTLAWESNYPDNPTAYLEVDGKALVCNAQNAAKIYADPRFEWLVDQLDAFVGNRRNFDQSLPDDTPQDASIFDLAAHRASIEGNSQSGPSGASAMQA